MARKITKRTEADLERSFEGESYGDGSPMNNHFISPNLKDSTRLIFPAVWKGGEMVFRPWPLLDGDDPETKLQKGRQNANFLRGLGGLACSGSVSTVNMAGLNTTCAPKIVSESLSVSYISHRAKVDDDIEGVPIRDLPYAAMRRTLKRLNKEGTLPDGGSWPGHWNPFMLSDSSDDRPAIQNNKNMFFFVGHVIANGQKFNLTREQIGEKKFDKRYGIPLGLRSETSEDGNAPDPLCVIAMSSSAGKSVLNLLSKLHSKIDPAGFDPDDWRANPSKPFAVGEPTGVLQPDGSLKGGVLIGLYNPDQSSPSVKKAILDVPANTNGFGTYASFATRSYNGGAVVSSMSPAQTHQIFEKQMWTFPPQGEAIGNRETEDSLFYIPTLLERCVMLAKAFAPVPDFVRTGWVNHPQYLELDEVQEALQPPRIGGIKSGKQKAAAAAEKPAQAAAADSARVESEDFDDEEDFDNEEFDDGALAAEGSTADHTGTYSAAELAAMAAEDDDEGELEDLGDLDGDLDASVSVVDDDDEGDDMSLDDLDEEDISGDFDAAASEVEAEAAEDDDVAPFSQGSSDAALDDSLGSLDDEDIYEEDEDLDLPTVAVETPKSTEKKPVRRDTKTKKPAADTEAPAATRRKVKRRP